MKHGKKPTSVQKKILSRNGLNHLDFLFIRPIGTGWLFQERNDESRFITVYPDRDGVFGPDGETPADAS